MITNRDFLGEEFWKKCQQDYQSLREGANQRGKPDEYDRIMIAARKAWESFYRAIL